VLVLAAPSWASRGRARDPTAEPRPATALVAQVTVPGQPAARRARSRPPTASGGGAFAYPADGSVLRVGTSTATRPRSRDVVRPPRARQGARVSAFAGEVTAESVDVRAGRRGAAGATATSARRRSPASSSSAARHAERERPAPLADWGTLDVLCSTRSTSTSPRSAESAVTGSASG
jgi:hypothetical protein